MINGMEKSKNCNADLENADTCYDTLLISHAFVNFLQFMTQRICSSKLKNLSPIRYLE